MNLLFNSSKSIHLVICFCLKYDTDKAVKILYVKIEGLLVAIQPILYKEIMLRSVVHVVHRVGITHGTQLA